MGNIGTAYLEVAPDTKGFGKKISKGIGPQMKIAGAAVAAGVGVVLKGAFDEAREAQKVGKQTAAVIKSTGGAAKVSAKQVGDLANAISRKVGVDDEAIQSSENLLLTFKNVKNEGKNKIFDTATKSIVDMTAAMNNGEVTTEGLRSSTIQVGKALNDPIKGMSALQRVGVTFTASQKDTIKSLVESGNTMKAQKLILRELNSEFAGSAEAGADGVDKFEVAVANIEESIGTTFLPVLSDGANAVADFLTEMQTGEGTGGKFASGLKDALGDIKQKIGPIKDSIGRIVGAVSDGFQGPTTDLGPFLNLPTDDRDTFSKFSDAIKRGMTQAIVEIDPQTIAEKLLEVTLKVINTAMDPAFLAKHIVDIIGIALAFSKIGFLRKIPLLGPALGKLGDFIWDFGKGTLKIVGGRLGGVLLDGLKWVLTRLPVEVGVLVIAGINKLKTFAPRFAAQGTTFGERLGSSLAKAVAKIPSQLLRYGGRFLSAAKDLGGDALRGLRSILPKALEFGGDVASRLARGVKGGASKVLQAAKDIGGKIGRGIKSGAESAFNGFVEIIRGPINGVIGVINRLIAAFNKLPGHRDIGAIPKMATGGFIGGKGLQDSQLILAAPGEAILNRHQQAIVNRSLAATGQGSLAGVFRKERTPHYQGAPAQGGDGIPAFSRGGYLHRYKPMVAKGNSIAAKGLAYSSPGPDCSWFVSQILEAGKFISGRRVSEGMRNSPMVRGAGKVVTVGVWKRPGTNGSGNNGHTMIKVQQPGFPPNFYESGSGHGPKKVGGWSMGFDYYHPRGELDLVYAGAAGKGKGAKPGGSKKKKKPKKAKKLTLQDKRDAKFARYDAELAAAEANDDDDDPSTYDDNKAVLRRRIATMREIIVKLNALVKKLTTKIGYRKTSLKEIATKLASKSISKATRKSLRAKRVKLTNDLTAFTTRRTKAFQDIAQYQGAINTDTSSIAGYDGKSTTAASGSTVDTSGITKLLLDQSQAQNRLLLAQMPIFEKMGVLGKYQYVGKYHGGGQIPGRPGQEVNATLLAGETVLPVGAKDAAGMQPVLVMEKGAIVNDAVDPEKFKVLFDRSMEDTARRVRSGPGVRR